MLDNDTGTLVADTEAEAVSTPTETTETEDASDTETEITEASETAAGNDDSILDRFLALSPEKQAQALEKSPHLRWLVETEKESAKQRAHTDEQERLRREAETRARQAEAEQRRLDALNGIVAEAVRNGESVDPLKLTREVKAIQAEVVNEAHENARTYYGSLIDQSQAKTLAKLGKLTPEQEQYLARSGRNLDEYFEARDEVKWQLRLAKELPALRKQWQAEEAKVAKAKQQEENSGALKGQSRPTGTEASYNGRGRAGYTSLEEAEAAHVQGKISSLEMRRLRGVLRYKSQ